MCISITAATPRARVNSKPGIALALAMLLAAGCAAAGEVEWRLLSDQANLHLQRGNIEQSELFACEAITEAERSFGRSHRATDQSIAMLGLVLRFAQRYTEAEKELRRALALREKSLGPDNPRTAITLNNLARVLLELGRKAEAEKLAAHAAAIHQGKGGRK